MTKQLITLGPSDSVADAANIFREHKIHHIPIVEDEKLVGIVSKTDFLFFKRGFLDDETDQKIEEIRMNNYEIRDIMTKGIAHIEPEDKINVAMELFKENIFHAIPVVKDGILKGLVTTYDIIKKILDDNEVHASYETK